MTARARVSAGNGWGLCAPGASAAAPSRAGALPGAAAGAWRLYPAPVGRWLLVATRLSGTASARSVR
jgi:hypothetical protein